MKKCFFAVLTLLFVGSIYAQQTKIGYGVMSGVNLSKYKNIPGFIEFQEKIGFYVGGYMNFGISKKLKIQTELLYVNRGAKQVEHVTLTDQYGVPIGEENFKIYQNESVISLPIIMQYFFLNTIALEGGVQAGYIVSSNIETIIVREENGQSTHMRLDYHKENYDKFDFGFTVGLGYHLLEKLRITGRYFQGLIKRDGELKSSVFSLGLAYDL